MDFSGSHKGR